MHISIFIKIIEFFLLSHVHEYFHSYEIVVIQQLLYSKLSLLFLVLEYNFFYETWYLHQLIKYFHANFSANLCCLVNIEIAKRLRKISVTFYASLDTSTVIKRCLVLVNVVADSAKAIFMIQSHAFITPIKTETTLSVGVTQLRRRDSWLVFTRNKVVPAVCPNICDYCSLYLMCTKQSPLIHFETCG